MGNNALVKPFLKWAGGKRQLIHELKKNKPPDFHPSKTTYYEPFVGAGAFLFALQPKKAVINDTNFELINCYEVIRDSVDELIEELAKHQQSHGEEYYYNIRDWDRSPDFSQKTKIERASRIIFLNKTCYNGLFRVNSQGQFNVPFGRYKNPNILDIAVLKAVSLYLKNTKIKIFNKDFKESVDSAKEGDFIYFDPPYDPVSDTSSFTGYDINRFNKSEQERLKLTFDELNKRGCRVLLSNSDTPFIRRLYSSYRIDIVSASRAINSNALKRGKINEVLVKNYD